MLATTMLVALPFTVSAQTARPTAEAPSVDPARPGVLLFTPDFFAASRPDTAFDMIGRLPGFSFDGGDNDTRGFAGAAGNVLIDGDRPASKSDGLDAVLGRISADSVERIELIRGGAPGIDMRGRPVVANVVLKRTVQIERVFEVNSYVYPDGYLGPSLGASWSRREGDSQLEASISATTDRTSQTGDGYRRRFDAAGRSTQLADLDLWDRYHYVSATAAWQQVVGGGKLRLNGRASWYSSESTIDTLITSGTGADEFSSEEDDELSGELGINWSRPLGERTEIELTGLQRYSTEQELSGSRSRGRTTAFGDDSTSGETIARAVLRYRPGDRWDWEAGGEGAYNVLDSATTYAENGVPIPLPSASVKVEELRGELFGQASWRPDPRFTAEAALRVEVSEIRQSGDSDRSQTFVYPKPRLQLTWSPAAENQFRLRLEREVGQLDFGDFVASADVDLNQVAGGNPEVEPEKIWVVEAVYERRFWGEGALTLTASRESYQDVIDVIPLTGGFEAVGNIGDGTQNSFRASLALPLDRLGLANARLNGRAVWRRAEVTDPLTGNLREASGQGTFGCGVSFDQDLRGGRWSWGVEHDCNVDQSRQYRIREFRSFEGEPEVTLYGQWKPRRDLTLRLDLGNVTDREQRRERRVYSGPRNTAPLAFREERGTRRDRFLFIQIRKTL